MKQLLFISIVIFSPLVSGQSTENQPRKQGESGEELVDRYRYRIEQTLFELKDLRPRCPGCELFVAGRDGRPSDSSPACRQMYKDLYRIKDKLEQETERDREIDMRVQFGYIDFGNEVDDLYAAIAFGTQITAPCKTGEFACGFVQKEDDAETFVKRIQVMGPDGKLRKRNVNLKMRYSSATRDERINRGEKKDEQDEITEKNAQFFSEGLRKADLLLYVGHARDGGGPDFGPPIVNPKTRRTDFAWYHRNTPGVKLMQEALTGAERTPRILGLFACFADKHFGETLKKAAPKSGLVLSGRSEFEAITGQAMATLDSSLGMRCEEAFTESVNVIKSIGDYEITPARLEGMFRKSRGAND